MQSRKEFIPKETFQTFLEAIPCHMMDDDYLRTLLPEKYPAIFSRWLDICNDSDLQYTYLVENVKTYTSLKYKRTVEDDYVSHDFEDAYYQYSFVFSNNFIVNKQVYKINDFWSWFGMTYGRHYPYNIQLDVKFNLRCYTKTKGTNNCLLQPYYGNHTYFKILINNDTEEISNNGLVDFWKQKSVHTNTGYLATDIKGSECRSY